MTKQKEIETNKSNLKRITTPKGDYFFESKEHWDWILDITKKVNILIRERTKALQSYSQEMNKVIGEYEEPSEYKNFGIEPIASEQIRNNLRQSQRQEKLKIDKKWGIK